MNLKAIVKATSLWLAAILLPGCASDNEPDAPRGGWADISMSLTLNNASSQSDPLSPRMAPATRAGGYGFELPSEAFETAIETIRIILVRPDDGFATEINRVYDLSTFNYDVTRLPDLRFRVRANENKRVYFIANEHMLSEEARNLLGSIAEGAPLPAEFYNILVETPASGILADNSGTQKHFIPMAEFFNFYIENPDPSSDIIPEVSKRYFITRAATKFRFSIDENPEQYASGIKVTRMEIASLATNEYLIPRNATYAPDKYAESAETYGGHAITDFDAPVQKRWHTAMFTPEAFGLNGLSLSGLKTVYAPAVYFCETKLRTANDFQFTMTAEIDGEERVFGPVTLPNLPQLPRNTVVDVHISLERHDLSLVVTLEPYRYVKLEPWFGFDDVIYHPDKYNNLDDDEKNHANPEEIEVPPTK